MKSVAVTFCLLGFQFGALYDQLHVSDPQVMVEFKSGNFKFIFHNPQNVSEFSMTLFKGHEKKEICALHVSKEKAIPKSNVTYCQAEHSNTSTTFILTNLERKHIDTYTYCLEMFLPPPYIDCRLKETYLYIQDKEDCISLGIMSWVTIGLIVFAMISCVCCVAACRLRNKVSKSTRFCTTLLPRVMDRELDLMRFRGWDRHILST
ncbi:uncharacterized protein LOC118259920 isoform X3 [Cygnus atratus]|uniref:uncharacterized protein LOC118259920 isoform X3 n=1 Tax=Cygnus atratus TaxID=8868 RepID=UPI0015D646A8|nr:uncharacterized protein LOC118259920 isoform X3 [Cygnus atratus]